MKVKELMTKTPYCCQPTDTVRRAATLMKTHDVGAIPVVTDSNDRKLVGIVTDRDICLKVVQAGKSNDCSVSEAMSKTVTTCHVDDTVESCEAKMERHQVRRIPVVDSNGICVGIVSQADIALHDSAEHTAETVAAISRHRVEKSSSHHASPMAH